MRFSFQQQSAFLLFIIFSLIGGVGFFVITPVVTDIRTLQTGIEETKALLETDHVKARQMRRTLQELPDIERELENYTGAFIEVGSELAVITELESLAAKHKLTQTLKATFTDVKPSPSGRPSTALPYYSFSFMTNGTFTDQMNYVRDLEQLPYYLIIDGFDWQKGNTKSGETTTSQVTLRFEGKIYATK